MRIGAGNGLITVGLVFAVGGFLLIDHYDVRFSMMGNIMTASVGRDLPYRVVLGMGIALVALGFWRRRRSAGKIKNMAPL